MVSLFFWILFGAVIAWVAAILRDERAPRGIVLHLLVGIAGGVIGGFVGSQLDPAAAAYQSSATGIMFALFGATSSVFLMSLTVDKRSQQ